MSIMVIIVIVMAVVALTGGIAGWLLGARRRQVIRYIKEAGCQFGLTPIPLKRDEFSEIWTSFSGIAYGFSLELIGGIYVIRNPIAVAASTVRGVPSPVILVRTELPRMLPFKMVITQARTISQRVFKTGDEEFDKICAIQEAGDIGRVRALLNLPALRDAVKRFIKPDETTNVKITNVAVETMVINPKKTTAVVRQATALAAQLIKAADRL